VNKTDLEQRIRQEASKAKMPDTTGYLSLSATSVHRLSAEAGMAARQVEIAALGLKIIPERYVRNFKTLDFAGQTGLLESSAAVVGLGGLGGLVLELLARAGVGRIKAADFDRFEESNLNRQFLATGKTIGTAKTEAAKLRVQDINPSVEFTAAEERLGPGELADFLKGADLAMDCLGGLDTRLDLQRAAAKANIPLVTAAVAGWSGYVAVVMPGDFGPSEMMGQGSPAEDELGNVGPCVCTAASLQCAEAVRILSGEKGALGARMLVFDLADMSFDVVRVTEDR